MQKLFESLERRQTKIAIVGLGYVGLPVAHAFSRKFAVVGFDIDQEKVSLLQSGIDPTGELPEGGLGHCNIEFTSDPVRLNGCGFIVIAVPTPVDGNHQPDLKALVLSSTTVGKYMPKGSVVVYESTVYPGVTEEECVPLLAEHSGMRYLTDFKVGYSPERINPGDREHRLQTVTKIVSGCDEATLELVAAVYGSIIDAGVYRAPSIRVAEAAKVIENTQRDINIALMNELSIIFHRLGIDTLEVLRAAETKWNFLKFHPGLVGGHCIGVDPYYLTHKAQSAGYHPEVILAGRCINDSMGKFVAENTIKELIKAGHTIMGRGQAEGSASERSQVLILGLTFKENVADIRNTRVVDIISELGEYNIESLIYDPLASVEAVRNEYGLEILPSLALLPPVDAVILAVPHDQFKELSLEKIASMCKKGATPVLMDLRGVFEPKMASKLGIRYWRL